MTKVADKAHWEAFLAALNQAAEGDYTLKIETGHSDDALLGRVAAAVNTLLDKTQKRINGLETFIQDQTRDARRYRHMLDTMEESYFEVDLKGNLVFFNETVMRDTGYSEEELRRMNFRRLADEKSHDKVYSMFHQVFLTGQPVKGFDWVIRRKDGGAIDVEASVALLRDPSGKPCGFRGVVRDVTGRKLSEQALVASQRKYRDILENMEETYLETDLKGNNLFFNNSLCRVLGYSRTELQGANYRLIIPRENLSSVQKLFHEIFVTGQRKTFFNHRLIAKDGSDIYLEMSISLLRSPSGDPVGFCGVGRNVTEKLAAERQLVERERRLRLITDNIRDVIWTMDFDWNYSYISPSIQHLIGYTPEEVKTVPFEQTVPPDIFKKMQQNLAEALAQEQEKPTIAGESRIYEVPLRHRDSDIIWAEVRSNFNRDENGKPFELVGVVRDITERKKVQDALAESEAIYRKTLETTSDGVAIIQENRYVYFNDRLLKTLGLPAGYRIGSEPMGILMHPEDRDVVLESYERHLRGESVPTKHELRIVRPNGKTITLMVTSAATVYRGKPAVLNFMQDITEAKRAEEALKDSEKRYRLIAENIDDIIWTMDFDMNWTYLSPSVHRLTGFSAEEILRIPVRALLPPETYTRMRRIIDEELAKEKNRDRLEKSEPVTLEMPMMRKDGSFLWVELSANFNRDENGRPFEIVGVTRNISERKKADEALRESEQRYRMIIENMREVIWTTDLNLNNTYVSPSCFFLTGYTPEEILQTSPERIMTPESMAVTAAIVMEEINRELSGEPADPHRTRTLEQEIICKDGSTIWLEVTGTFIRDDQGRAIGMLMAGRDIAARKKAERERSSLEQQLVQAQKMETVGRLAGGVAHDFNNMLSVILGYVDLAKMRLARQHPVLNDIAEIEKAALRSRDITMQLLAFSRKQIIEPKIVDLCEMVASTQKAIARLIGEDIDLTVHAGNDVGAVKIDPSQVEQILINLAVNARDAMPRGGKLTIEIAGATLDEAYCEAHIGANPGRYVRLSVSDNGTGMNKETLKHLFEPFFTTKEEGKGTGLGLATVYGIVKQNEGFINVDSEPGYGTTFTLYLPRVGDIIEQHDSTKDPEIDLTGSGRILVVEDDPMVLQIAKGMLESLGYTVTATHHPKDAVAIFTEATEPFDLVLTDVVMPSMSGKDLKNRLVEIRPDLKVLFISGYTADIIAHHGILEEGIQFLQKPFTIQSLARKVSDLLIN